MIDDDDLDPIVSEETPVEDAADARANRSKRRELDIREGERQAFWRSCLGSKVGRRELWGLLADAHFDADRFGAGPTGVPDLAATWLGRGEQAFGYRLFLTLLKHDRGGVFLMLEEHDHRLAKPQPLRRRRKDDD